jgi:hypothetical protein
VDVLSLGGFILGVGRKGSKVGEGVLGACFFFLVCVLGGVFGGGVFDEGDERGYIYA